MTTCTLESQQLYWKRVITVVFFMLGVLLYFWFASRYPALLFKAGIAMDGSVLQNSLTGLSLSQRWEITGQETLWIQVIKNTGNWMMANIKGMTFGIVFGGLFMSLLQLLLPLQRKFNPQ